MGARVFVQARWVCDRTVLLSRQTFFPMLQSYGRTHRRARTCDPDICRYTRQNTAHSRAPINRHVHTHARHACMHTPHTLVLTAPHLRGTHTRSPGMLRVLVSVAGNIPFKCNLRLGGWRCRARACNMQHATCSMNMQHATCNMQHAPGREAAAEREHAACNMQHAACNMQHATCNMQHAPGRMAAAERKHATCNTLHATCFMQHFMQMQPAPGRMAAAECEHATCDMRHATCTIQHATCNMRHATCAWTDSRRRARACSMQHATCNMQHAT